MDKRPVKKAWGILGCAVCWMFTAFFAFLEWAAASWVWELLPDVINYGYDEAAGYNLHLAEDFWEARVFMVLFGIPLILMLVLAIRSTIQLTKAGKEA